MTMPPTGETPPPQSGATPPPAVSWASPEPEFGPPSGVEFAPHGARLVAFVLDVAVLLALWLVFAIIGIAATFALGGDRTMTVSRSIPVPMLVTVIVIWVVWLSYFPFFWARGGRTPGMRPFGLRVVNDRDGTRIGWGAAIVRLIGFVIAFWIFFIGIIWILFDKRRRGWQDLIAGTVVIKQP